MSEPKKLKHLFQPEPNFRAKYLCKMNLNLESKPLHLRKWFMTLKKS